MQMVLNFKYSVYILMLLTLFSNANAFEQLSSKKTEELAKATAIITLSNNLKPSEGRSGTAFFVEPNLIITSLHTIYDYQEPHNQVELITFSGVEIKNIKIAYISFSEDLALLKVDYNNPNFIALKKIKDSRNKINRIFGIGNMHGWGMTQFTGDFITHGYSDGSSVKPLIVSNKFRKGNSGGPVVDKDGILVGVSKELELKNENEIQCFVKGTLGILTPAISVKQLVSNYKRNRIFTDDNNINMLESSMNSFYNASAKP